MRSFLMACLRRLTTLDVEDVLATIEPWINRLVRRRGLAADAHETDAIDTWAYEAPVLAGLAAASMQGTAALGPRRGTRPARVGTVPQWPSHARQGRAMHARTASAGMPRSSSPPDSASAWNACAGTCCARPSPSIVCM